VLSAKFKPSLTRLWQSGFISGTIFFDVRSIERIEREYFDETRNPLAPRKQFPLALAWAITIHQLQGQTLESLEVDLSKYYTLGIVYVALSRGVSLNRMIIGNVNKGIIQAASGELDFYAELT